MGDLTPWQVQDYGVKRRSQNQQFRVVQRRGNVIVAVHRGPVAGRAVYFYSRESAQARADKLNADGV